MRVEFPSLREIIITDHKHHRVTVITLSMCLTRRKWRWMVLPLFGHHRTVRMRDKEPSIEQRTQGAWSIRREHRIFRLWAPFIMVFSANNERDTLLCDPDVALHSGPTSSNQAGQISGL